MFFIGAMDYWKIGVSQQGVAHHGVAQHGATHHSVAQHGVSQHGVAQHLGGVQHLALEWLIMMVRKRTMMMK